MKRFLTRVTGPVSVLAMAATLAMPAAAIEYRTVNSATVLYDAQSVRGTKLFVIKRDTPVEVVISLADWAKIRDADGSLAWIEKKFLSDKRSVIVTAERAEIRQKAEEGAPLVFEAEKNVVLDYLEPATGGWIKVKHRDGQTGYVRGNQIWGL